MKQLVTLFLLAAAFAQAQDQRGIVRTGVAGVLIDVTVVDKDGRAVTDLEATDFEIAEDGKPQQIISATLMQGGAPAPLNAAPEAGTTATPSDVRAAAAPPPAVRPVLPTVTAILFDGLSANTRPFAVRAAAGFVSTLATGHEYAGVFLSGMSLITLQPFTNRTSDLRAAVDRVADTASPTLWADAARKQSGARTQGLDPATPVTTDAEYTRGWTTIAEREQRLYSSGSEAELTRLALRMEQGYARLLDEYEGESSISGLHAAIAALAPLPGRKSILFFTEELPVTSRLKSRFDAVIAEANRANITVYPVDAAGLRVHSQEDETARGVGLAGAQGVGDASRGDGAWTKGLEQQSQQLSSRTSAVLGRLANETGGFLIDNTNDLGKGVSRMQVERTTYYLLGYQPTNAAQDGKFRKVTVKVKRGKYTVRARPGYVAASR